MEEQITEEDFRCYLEEEIGEGNGVSKSDYKCKISNIEAFLHIDREGLQNGKLEKRLLMYKSLAEEKVFIQYPGKESTKVYANADAKNMLNPNDFRPELYMPDGEISAKLSFVDIAESIVEYCWTQNEQTIQMLAAIIIRIAYMKGYKYKEILHPSQLIKIDYSRIGKVLPSDKKEIIGRYFLPLNSELKEYLSSWNKINLPNRSYKKKIAVSIEGFLYYLDILAQQEDCKYYYTGKIKGVTCINITIGRINNLLTLVNIINRLLCNRPYGDIIATMGKYVRPLNSTDFEQVTGGIIKTIRKEENILELKIR